MDYAGCLTVLRRLRRNAAHGGSIDWKTLREYALQDTRTSVFDHMQGTSLRVDEKAPSDDVDSSCSIMEAVLSALISAKCVSRHNLMKHWKRKRVTDLGLFEYLYTEDDPQTIVRVVCNEFG